MSSLSLAMIVKDEEETLARILADAASFCDELIVVDTGSTDASRSLAAAAGARIVDFPWIDDFAAARNASFEACSSDWIIWLDADDAVPLQVQEGLRLAKVNLLNDDLDAVWMPYRYHFSPETGQCTFSLTRERIIRRAAGLRWNGRVHEVLNVTEGKTAVRDDLYVEHRPDPAKSVRRVGRNIRILESAVADGDVSARTLYYYANELRDNNRFEEALANYKRYMTTPGVDWEAYAGHVSMLQCAARLGLHDEAVQHGLSAIALDTSRAEAFLAVGDLFFERREWARAAPLYAAATGAQRPTTGFVADADYSWRAWDSLSVCLINSGRLKDGITAALRSLDAGNPEVLRVKSNLRWAIDALP